MKRLPGVDGKTESVAALPVGCALEDSESFRGVAFHRKFGRNRLASWARFDAA
jgi:hypothetical protein